LARKAYEADERDNVYIEYGFSNDSSFPIEVKKLNWIEMPNRKVRVKVLNWRNVLKNKIRNKFFQIVLAGGADLILNKALSMIQRRSTETDLTFNHIAYFDERFDELWNNIRVQAQIMTVRNKEYLNWRYHTPYVNYDIISAERNQKIYGYISMQIKIERNIKMCIIFDLIATLEKIKDCLLYRALEECRRERVDIIYLSSITDSTYRRILANNGFVPLPFNTYEYFNIYSTSPSIPKEFLINHRNWLISAGDLDQTYG